jgi:hypothetical protein
LSITHLQLGHEARAGPPGAERMFTRHCMWKRCWQPVTKHGSPSLCSGLRQMAHGSPLLLLLPPLLPPPLRARIMAAAERQLSTCPPAILPLEWHDAARCHM